MKEVHCTNCGITRPEGINFCPNCGAKMEVIERDELQSETTTQVESVAEELISSNTISQQVVESKFVENNQVEIKPESVQSVSTDTYSYKKKGPSAGKKVLAVLVCLVGSLFLTVLILLLSFRSMISQGGMKSLLNTIEKQSEDLYEDLIDEIDYGYFDVDDIMEVEGFEEIAGDAASSIVKYMLSGEGDPIDTTLITDWIEDNKKEIEKCLDVEISKDDIKEIKSELKEFSKEIKQDVIEDIEDEYEDELRIVRLVFGMTAVIVFIVLTLICFGFVFLIFGKFYDKSIVYSGTTIVVNSSIGIAGATVMMVLARWIAEMAGADEIDFLLRFMAGKYMSTAGVFLLVAVVMIVVGRLLRKKNKAYLA